MKHIDIGLNEINVYDIKHFKNFIKLKIGKKIKMKYIIMVPNKEYIDVIKHGYRNSGSVYIKDMFKYRCFYKEKRNTK